jgi:hypothetical protein
VKKNLLIVIFVLLCNCAYAQFAEGVNLSNVGAPPGASAQQTTNANSDVQVDTTKGFGFKHLFRGLAHKEPLKPGYAMMSTLIMPGSLQIYNKDYWKLPILYGGMGAGIYGGIHFNNQYKVTGDPNMSLYSTLSFVGAGLFYWAAAMDGIVKIPGERRPDPAKAVIFSALLPGLGQALNGDWWHIPIYYGGFAICGYCYHSNHMQYERFKNIYSQATSPNSGYKGHITADQAKHYMDTYRRYRDYSLVATILVYALNIIDAHVFAVMHDFEVNDNLSIALEPTIIEPARVNQNYYAFRPDSSFGLQMNLKF